MGEFDDSSGYAELLFCGFMVVVVSNLLVAVAVQSCGREGER